MTNPTAGPFRAGADTGTSVPGGRAWLAFAALYLGAVAAIVVVYGESSDLPWMNHDAANVLYLGCRLVAGDALYVDWAAYYLMPASVLLSAAACGTAQATGLASLTVLHLFVVTSAGLGLCVLRQAFPGSIVCSLGLLLAYLSLLAPDLPFLDRSGSLPGAFAQREHFFVLLLVPYLFWRGSDRPASAALRALVVLLGFTMMVKPHFVAAVAASELLFVREPGRRAVVWLPLGVGASLSFAALLLHSPEAFGAFFSRVVPYHLGGAYDSYGHGLGEFLWSRRHADVLALIVAVLGLGAWAVRRGVAPRRLVVCTAVSLLVLYLGFLQQGKFFFYHLIPTAGLAFVACAALLGWSLQSLKVRGLRRSAMGVLVLLLVGALGIDLYELQRLFAGERAGRATLVLPLLADRELVAVISPAVEGPIFRYALTHDVELMGPLAIHYRVPSLLRIEDPSERRAAFQRYFAPVAERIRDEAPELILFSPARAQEAMDDRHIHEVFREMRLVPIEGYRLVAVRSGWFVYERLPAPTRS